MHADRARSALNIALAVALALLVGVAGLWTVFTDVGPNESRAARWLMTGLVYALGATAVGALVPRRWYLALLAAWGPVVLGAVGLVAKLANGGAVPYWRFLATNLLGVPAVALLFGYLGMRARRPQAR